MKFYSILVLLAIGGGAANAKNTDLSQCQREKKNERKKTLLRTKGAESGRPSGHRALKTVPKCTGTVDGAACCITDLVTGGGGKAGKIIIINLEGEDAGTPGEPCTEVCVPECADENPEVDYPPATCFDPPADTPANVNFATRGECDEIGSD